MPIRNSILSMLSQGARKKIQHWSSIRSDVKRDNWDVFFMRQAINMSKRSPDAQTKVGAVLVRDKTIITSGYNGHIREARDEFIPNIRPDKYPFMMHAEVNAIFNAARLGLSTLNSTCYCTHQPCEQCLQFLWQSGIREIVYLENSFAHSASNNDEFYEIFQFLTRRLMTVRSMKIDEA
jgi:dCMP deaminase